MAALELLRSAFCLAQPPVIIPPPPADIATEMAWCVGERCIKAFTISIHPEPEFFPIEITQYYHISPTILLYTALFSVPIMAILLALVVYGARLILWASSLAYVGFWRMIQQVLSLELEYGFIKTMASRLYEWLVHAFPQTLPFTTFPQTIPKWFVRWEMPQFTDLGSWLKSAYGGGEPIEVDSTDAGTDLPDRGKTSEEHGSPKADLGAPDIALGGLEHSPENEPSLYTNGEGPVSQEDRVQDGNDTFATAPLGEAMTDKDKAAPTDVSPHDLIAIISSSGAELGGLNGIAEEPDPRAKEEQHHPSEADNIETPRQDENKEPGSILVGRSSPSPESLGDEGQELPPSALAGPTSGDGDARMATPSNVSTLYHANMTEIH